MKIPSGSKRKHGLIMPENIMPRLTFGEKVI
jgi:hypothetical protein